MPTTRTKKTGPTPLQIERERRIFDACLQLLTTHGDENLTIRDLAAASGVAVATLYNRYGTRDALIARVVLDQYQTRIQSKLDLADTSQAPLAQLLSILHVIVVETRRAKAFARVLLGAYFRTDTHREMPARLHDAVLRTVAVPIARMRAGQELLDWVESDALAEEVVNRYFAVSLLWAQGRVPGTRYEQRVLSSVLMSLAAVSAPAQAKAALERLERTTRR